MDEAVTLARAYDDTELHGWALGVGGRLARLSGEPGESLARACEAVEIADRLGSSFSLSMARFTSRVRTARAPKWDEASSAASRALEIARRPTLPLSGSDRNTGELNSSTRC
jgi:hypothetical protein